MRVLQVCLKPPYPKVDGGCVAEAAMTECLLAGRHYVKCLTMATHKHPYNPSSVPQDVLEKTGMEAVRIDTRIKPGRAFLNLFRSGSYNIERFMDEEFENRLCTILRQADFDTILLESLYCTPYIAAIRSVSNAKIVVRTHNIEHLIWRQLASGARNPIKKWYLHLLSRRLKRYETTALSAADAITPITQEDAAEIKSWGINSPMKVIPTSVKIKQNPVAFDGGAPLRLYHLGAMDWQPNVEGINWFINEVWPLINRELPQVECHLAGRRMPSQLLKQGGGKLYVSGTVASAEEFVADKTIAIVPLISGSGLRVKIVEAMASGKVVITTSRGASGIPCKHGRDLLIADSPNAFLRHVHELSSNPKRISEIGKNAHAFAKQAFSVEELSSKLTYFCQQLSRH